MIVGTIAGLPLGVLQSSTVPPVRWIARFATQFFRNSPWLVLLFLCVLLLPFQIRIFGVTIPVPDWIKAILGLLPAGHGQRVGDRARRHPVGATSQWESAESLGFSRTQTLMRDHPAAVLQAHAAALDEPLLAPHHVDA